MKQENSIFIHPSSIVEECSIGSNTKIWHWVHISKGATIGKNCTLGQNVFVGGKSIIGNNVKIQNNVSVFDKVILKDFVFCGPSVVFTNINNPRSEISRKEEYQETIVDKGTTIGANATIICGNNIGEYAFIGAGAVVNKNVLPFALMVGVPAKQIGWMSAFGERIELPLFGNGLYNCEKSGDVYKLINSSIIRIKNEN